jgi:hypothetical protein
MKPLNVAGIWFEIRLFSFPLAGLQQKAQGNDFYSCGHLYGNGLR